jgi:signal peptidase II
MLERSKRIRILSASVIAGVAIDQLSKYAAMIYLDRDQIHSFWHDTLRVLYTENTGAFLSVGAQMSADTRFWLFTVGVFMVLVLATTYIWRSMSISRSEVIGYSLAVAGGLGNLIDRVWFQGLVRDFLNVGFGSLRTGVFNIADMLITAAVLTLLLGGIPEHLRNPARPADAPARKSQP